MLDDKEEKRKRLLVVAQRLVEEGSLVPRDKHYLYLDGNYTLISADREPERAGYLGRVYINLLREVEILELPE